MARAPDDVHVRNSNHPDRGNLTVRPAAMAAFIQSCKTGELDDLIA